MSGTMLPGQCCDFLEQILRRSTISASFATTPHVQRSISNVNLLIGRVSHGQQITGYQQQKMQAAIDIGPQYLQQTNILTVSVFRRY